MDDIKTQVQFVKGLKSLISTKEEISVTRIQKIRDNVLKTREFTTGLSTITADIKNSYKKQIDEITQKGKIEDLIKAAVSVKKGAWVSVLITPNTSLSGTIVPKVYSLFFDNLSKSFFTDVVIIGALGRQIYEQKGLNKPFVYFDLPEGNWGEDSFKKVFNHLLGYARIDVYYGKYYNLVDQAAVKTDVTAEKLLFEPAEQEVANINYEVRKFLFEPHLVELLRVMESQFLALFLQHIFHESDLAQLGSKITFMEGSRQKIEEKLKKLKFQNILLKKNIARKKTQQTFAGMSLWR